MSHLTAPITENVNKADGFCLKANLLLSGRN